jgi:hypothetical protein
MVTVVVGLLSGLFDNGRLGGLRLQPGAFEVIVA